jgi:regulator of sigma E protease
LSALSGFILILLGFGFLIFIHELGHFLAAKWAGIRADGFAIGMGPCLVSYRRGVGLVAGSADAVVMRKHGRRPIAIPDHEMRSLGLGETEYSLRALPIGGYVRMLGQEDGNPEAVSEDARSFTKAPIFRRGVVILAGIAANLALAIVLFLVAFLAGVRFPAPTIGGVASKSPAAAAESLDPDVADGLRAGDRVVAIDGEATETFLDIRLAAAMAKPETALDVTVARGDAEHRFRVTPVRDPMLGLLSIGVVPASSATITDVRASQPIIRETLERDAPGLVEAGVGGGSTVVSVNGVAVGSFADIERTARESDGAMLDVVWNARVEGDEAPRDEAPRDEAPRTVRTTMTPEPIFQRLQSLAPDGVTAVDEEGIVGFAPLVRIADIDKSSLNKKSLLKGDAILRVGSVQGPRLVELQRILRASPNATIPALVLRDGRETSVDIRTDAKGLAGLYLLPAYDLPYLANSVSEIVSAATVPGEGDDAVAGTGNGDGDGARPRTRPAPAAALQAMPLGWITAVGGAPVADFRALRAALVAAAKSHQGDGPLTLTVTMRDPSPDAAPADMPLVLASEDLAALRSLGHTFPLSSAIFDPNFTVLTANGNPLTAIAMGFRQTIKMVEQVFLTLDRVGRGSVGVEQLQGPVGILHTGTQVADEGFMYVLFFLALISVNLAVVNALPIPIADGGLFMFLMYEKIRGKPPSIGFQNAAAMAGIALVAGIFLLTFYNDIMRLFA